MTDDDVRCKGVHVKLDRATHTNFKAQLLQYDVTMQQAFEEFAKQVGCGNISANNIIEKMIRTRVKEELATVGVKQSTRVKKPRYLNQLDAESLYDLINESDSSE